MHISIVIYFPFGLNLKTNSIALGLNNIRKASSFIYFLNSGDTSHHLHPPLFKILDSSVHICLYRWPALDPPFLH